MAHRGTVAGVILASGMSTRFGADNKLLLTVEGVPLVRRAARVYLGAGLSPVVVVVGYDAARVEMALQDLNVTLVQNPDFAQGQSRALVRGVAALGSDIAAAVIGVADQPFLTEDVLRSLVLAWVPGTALLVAPRYAGRRGNPMLFDRALFPELLDVAGDQGGRPVFRRHQAEAVYVDFDALPGEDVDTTEDYRRLS